MNRWKVRNRKYLLNLLIISSLLLTSVPTNVLLSDILLETKSNSINSLSNSNESGIRYLVPKLTKDSITCFSEKNNSTGDSSSKSDIISNFAIGSKEGIGGGTYSVNESFDWKGSELLSIQNSIGVSTLTPTDRHKKISFQLPTDYSQENIFFSISNVKALNDWRIIDNETGQGITYSSNVVRYSRIAQRFNVTNGNIKLLSVLLYLTIDDGEDGDGELPIGYLSIRDDNSGIPGNPISGSEITLESQFLPSIAFLDDGGEHSGYVNYTFSSPLELNEGSYYIVLNDTGDPVDQGYWKWQFSDDSLYGNYDSWYSNAGGSWTINNGIPADNYDILGSIRILDCDETFNERTYSDPTDIEMHYIGTSDIGLTSFSFSGHDVSSHQFATNSSISFDLSLTIRCVYSGSKIEVRAKYLANNNTIVKWYLDFTTMAIDNTTYSVKDRYINITDLQTDWNGSAIYLDGTLKYNTSLLGGLNTSVIYINQTTEMKINTSSLSTSSDWNISFEAQNYLYDFNLSRGGLFLNLPYETNVTDTLNLNFLIHETGGNISYWIEYYGQPIHKRTDFNSTHISFSDPWYINDNVSQITNVNGTYNLQGFWISSDKTKVGTITRNLDVYINTTLAIKSTDTIEVIIPETTTITILANYTSNHNSTVGNPSHIKNAKIWCNASWPDAARQNVTMSQPVDTYYSASLDTSGQSAGDTETITITTQLPWFVNWTTTIKVLFVQNTTLSANVTTVVIEWRENITIEFDYNETEGDRLSTATITLVDTNEYFTYSNAMYSFQLNSTSFPGTGLYTDVVIKANSSSYLTCEWYFNLSITPGITNIFGKIDTNPVLNDSTIINRLFSVTSADSVTLNLQYYYTRATDPLDTNSPIIESEIPYLSPIKDVNDLSWNITFNPDKTGDFKINITFNLLNYNSSTFIFLFNIQKATTLVFTTLESPINVYFTESLDFYLLLNNTDYNELIQGIIPIINDTAVTFVNHDSDYYWFEFDSNDLELGFHTIQITFTHVNFKTCSIFLTFNVIEMLTLAILTENAHLTNNGMIQIEQNLVITIDNYQTIHGDNITKLDEVYLWLNGSFVPIVDFSLLTSQTPFNIEFYTTGWQYGFYNLTIQIHSIGYQAQSIQMNITLTGISTEIEIEIEPGKNIQQGEEVIITVTLSYITASASGYGAGVTQSVPLEGISIYYYIIISYENGTARTFQVTIPTDSNGQAIYIIDGKFTKGATGFTNITAQSAPGLSGIPASYSMSSSDLESYKILPPPIDILEIIATVLIGVFIFIVAAFFLAVTVRTVRRRTKRKKQLILRHDIAVEQSFEDIKSIRLIIARHESGLQFYSEKTIAEIQTDTDALSGMSAALSTFMEEISDSMVTSPEKYKKNQIEVMSREGLHMLIWHGAYSSLIIISEIKLPDYFQDRLIGLGNELEKKFEDDLKDFYSTDQIPSSVVKKMVRKYIPLHHFSAFVLNEGVLTLKSIKLNKKEKRMLKLIKDIRFDRNGVSYFFSEQIISHLSRHIKRSGAIEWLEKAIEINLLIEASQEDLISIHTS